MQKKTALWLWITGGVVVVGGAALAFGPSVYADYANSVADAAPTLAPATGGPDAASRPAVDPAELSGDWSVSAGSFAGYRVDEVLQNQEVTVTGRTDDVSGDLSVDGLTLTAATITVDVASIATDEGARDAYFRDSAMQADEYPTATFALTEPVAIAAPAAGVAQTVSTVGELTLHGVTRPVTVQLQAALTGTGGQVVGSIPVTFSDFGVDAPNLSFVSVEDTGAVEFSLNLAQQ